MAIRVRLNGFVVFVSLIAATLVSPIPLSGSAVAASPGSQTLDAGHFHSCAVLADATVRCWGSNSFGQLGDGTGTDSTSPVAVSGITTADRGDHRWSSFVRGPERWQGALLGVQRLRPTR